MNKASDAWKRLVRHYWIRRFYHAFVADAVTIQRPTNHKLVREFLWNSLGVPCFLKFWST